LKKEGGDAKVGAVGDGRSLPADQSNFWNEATGKYEAVKINEKPQAPAKPSGQDQQSEPDPFQGGVVMNAEPAYDRKGLSAREWNRHRNDRTPRPEKLIGFWRRQGGWSRSWSRKCRKASGSSRDVVS
jgi:hypothetical protein